MTAPRLLTPNQIIVKSGTYVVIESIAGATLTCGSQSYTLGSGETIHAFEVTTGTYVCTANLTGYYEASASVPITSGFEYVTLIPTLLPTAYQPVEYLHSDGNQYIVTNVTNGANQTINHSVTFDSNATYRVFGTANTESQFIRVYVNNSDQRYLAANNASATTQHGTPTFAPGVVYNIILNANTTLTINGIDYAGSNNYGGATTQNYFWLFKKEGDTTQGLVGRIYYFNILQNGSKIIDLVPCYRKSDSVAGMYDIVTDTFLTNSGTGSFTVGADV